jgi:hypothetical protein
MKRERLLQCIDTDQHLIQCQQRDIDRLRQTIENEHKHRMQLEHILVQYQPHWNLLVQVNRYCVYCR